MWEKIFNFIKDLLMKLVSNKRVEIVIEPTITSMKNFILKEDQFTEFKLNRIIQITRRRDKETKEIMNKFVDFQNVYVTVYNKSLYGEHLMAGVTHMKDSDNRTYEFTLVLMK